MRTWIYEYPTGERGEEHCRETITDDEILEDCWDWWKLAMENKYGKGSPKITKENCIRDWVTTNWAWEDKK